MAALQPCAAALEKLIVWRNKLISVEKKGEDTYVWHSSAQSQGNRKEGTRTHGEHIFTLYFNYFLCVWMYGRWVIGNVR